MPQTKGRPRLCHANSDLLWSRGGGHNSHSSWCSFLCILTHLPSLLIPPSSSLHPALLAEARVRFPLQGELGCFSSHSKDPQLLPAQPPLPGGRKCVFHPNSLHQGSYKMSKVILHSQLAAPSFGHCCRTMMLCTVWRGMGL